jgi:phage terminase large subunit-like protein
MDYPVCDAAADPRYAQAWLPTCSEIGPHFCAPRAQFVVSFFERVLVHTKGIHARRPFILADWQRDEIINPLFGMVVLSDKHQRYIRRYRSAWIELGRKNGKSELLAGIMLYLLLFDGEIGAEIYGAAKDRDQARIIWDVAQRMVRLSPALRGRRGLTIRMWEKRIVDERTGSYYRIVPRDALGNLGHDPLAVVFDEVIAQPDNTLWDAMRTSMGSRMQPLMLAATTAGNDPTSFAAAEHREVVKIAEDPGRAEHRFVYCRNTAEDADPWDESNWYHANPALGDFLNIDALRDEAVEARNDPLKENAFRQFRLNQWVKQSSRWMPMQLYAQCSGEIWPNILWRPDALAGQEVWVGLDLSARQDLTSLCVWAPPKAGVAGQLLWWHWLPEDVLPALDQATSGQASQWVRAGFLRLMDGAVIDYLDLCEQIAVILRQFKVREISYDKWSGEYVRQELARRLGRVAMVANEPTYAGMTIPLKELMTLASTHSWEHHGNPVAWFCFDSIEVRRSPENPELIKPVKPDRRPDTKRIDAVVTAALAIGAWRVRGQVDKPRRTAHGFS